MKLLLTPDQEATLWNHSQTIVADDGKKYMYFPHWLRIDGNGEYERLRFDQIPENVKDKLLINQGIKLPSE
jgi:hypothetical protein